MLRCEYCGCPLDSGAGDKGDSMCRVCKERLTISKLYGRLAIGSKDIELVRSHATFAAHLARLVLGDYNAL